MHRRWAVYLLVFSIPLKTIDVAIAASHPFDLPELALLVVCVHFAVGVWNRRNFQLGNSTIVTYAFAFSVVALLSVLYLAVHPANILVHPYNINSGFGAFELAPLSFSSTNVTQLFLRWFVVGGIVVLASMLTRADVRLITRWIVVSAVVVGLFGVVYQVSILTNVGLADTLHVLGFRRFPSPPTFVGPLPRMYSFTGEPGATASFILYALAIAITFVMSDSNNGVLRRREAIAVAVVLFVLLVLTTGTTGYGGLGILVGVTIGATALVETVSRRRILSIIAAGGCVALVGAISLAAFSGLNVSAIIAYQVGKLTLQEASGSLRIRYLQYAFELFHARPILGLGVGSHQTTSLFGTILVETGLAGLALFVAYHVQAFRDCVTLDRHNETDRTLAVALAVGGTTVFLTLLFTRSASALQLPWYWFSVALPLAYVSAATTDSKSR